MLQNKTVCILFRITSILSIFLFGACSNQKNTALTRFYHSTNTRYNIHFNAEEAYKETLKTIDANRGDNLSEMLYVFPDNSDSTSSKSSGSFTTTIDKTTKAIKLHSIKVKPKRDPNRRNDADYQAWLQQKEFTPFMDKVWLLLAKAEFHDGNYLRSVTTFMHISKIYGSNPNIVAECRLWTARAYTEMGWIYEAGDILRKMEQAGGAPEKQKGLYSAVKANYLARNKEFAAAIPHLEYAIKKEKDKHQRLRMKYFLGQLYAENGDKANAYKAFGAVQGMNTPYKFTFNAKLQQLQLDSSKGETEIIASLEKMAKSSKNEEYQDQIYYNIGNIYLQRPDTAKAVGAFNKAVKESTRNGYDKAMAQIALGDIYFEKQEYIPAQPCYSEVLSQIKKSHAAYPRVSLRSSILDELVVHVRVMNEQDSLQYLAQLPEEERLQIINKKIDDLKKEEEKKIKEEERQKQVEDSQNRISSWGDIETSLSDNNTSKILQAPISTTNTASFYFYNEPAVTQGRIAFQKQWGNRKLEDDWRRRNKSSSQVGFSDVEEMVDDSLLIATEGILPDTQGVGQSEGSTAVEDIYSVEYYLQQLPLTAEAVKESDELIENALFNIGKIYKDKLGDLSLAIEAFNTNISRFPQTPNLEEIYYQLFLIYMQRGDRGMMTDFRNKLLSEFSKGAYATPLSQPDYEWNFRHMPLLTDSLYNSAYSAYQQADVAAVRRDYQTMNEKYPLTDMMPKFAFLNALTYAQSRDIDKLEENLKDLTTKYPKSEVTPLASDILGRIKDGQVLLSDGTPITNFDWSRAYLSDSILVDEEGKSLVFSDNRDTEYLLLLMFKANAIDRNELLYEVADYNFSNYVIQTYDVGFDTNASYDILQIKGFTSFANVKSYLNRAFAEGGLMHKIDTSINVVPISIENFTNALPLLGLEQYKTFFAEHYKDELPNLIAYWDKNTVDVEELILPDVKEQKDITEQIKETEREKPVESKKEEEVVVVEKQPEKEVNDKEITAEDLLTEEQLAIAGKANDVVESIEDMMSNPVDGIKNLFNTFKSKENLTKEEKAAFKEEQKLEKQRQRELKAIEEVRKDSIRKVEKAQADSIIKAEKALQDSIKAVEKERKERLRTEAEEKKNAEKAIQKAKEDAVKQKENARKEKEREQEERLRQQTKDRREKEKAQDERRKQKEREQKDRLKQREKERSEKEKVQEAARKEKEKQAEEKRRQLDKNKH